LDGLKDGILYYQPHFLHLFDQFQSWFLQLIIRQLAIRTKDPYHQLLFSQSFLPILETIGEKKKFLFCGKATLRPFSIENGTEFDLRRVSIPDFDSLVPAEFWGEFNSF